MQLEIADRLRRAETFQSSPAPEGECNTERPMPPDIRTLLFQSSPAPEGECNVGRSVNEGGMTLVSILTRP